MKLLVVVCLTLKKLHWNKLGNPWRLLDNINQVRRKMRKEQAIEKERGKQRYGRGRCKQLPGAQCCGNLHTTYSSRERQP